MSGSFMYSIDMSLYYKITEAEPARVASLWFVNRFPKYEINANNY